MCPNVALRIPVIINGLFRLQIVLVLQWDMGQAMESPTSILAYSLWCENNVFLFLQKRKKRPCFCCIHMDSSVHVSGSCWCQCFPFFLSLHSYNKLVSRHPSVRLSRELTVSNLFPYGSLLYGAHSFLLLYNCWYPFQTGGWGLNSVYRNVFSCNRISIPSEGT